MKTDNKMSILEKIVEQKKIEIEKLKKEKPLNLFLPEIKMGRDFFLNKESSQVQIIAEIKRASPSKGDICLNLDPEKKSKEYESGGASAVSVLTENAFFKGSMDDFLKVKKSVGIPVLRKDFIIDEYQVYESTYFNADCILLIARILEEKELINLYEKALSLKMVPLVEIYSDDDLEKIKSLKNTFIGINNRNLENFNTSLDNALFMAEKIDASNHIISLSGINSADDAKYLFDRGIKNFLIGEYLSKSENSSEKIKEILSVCNLSDFKLSDFKLSGCKNDD